MITFLGIESSCDDVGVAIVSSDKTIHAEKRLSHIEINAPFGGVVPELTARAHLQNLKPLILATLEAANMSASQLDGFAATAGPGLIGGLIAGVQMAKGLSLFHKKPFIAVNHLEGHALTPRLTQDLDYPYLLLLASGGHTQFLLVKGVGNYELIGTTLDDALGEAFDKTGKMLGLSYPAGPEIEKFALHGSHQFTFPMPLCHRPGFDFSFSGLKSDVRRKITSLGELTEQNKRDIATSFQITVTEILINRLKYVLKKFGPIPYFVFSGGVAANQYIRQKLTDFLAKNGVNFVAPPLSLCTDNGSMIAWAAIENFLAGRVDTLQATPRPRWPLQELSL